MERKVAMIRLGARGAGVWRTLIREGRDCMRVVRQATGYGAGVQGRRQRDGMPAAHRIEQSGS